MSDGKTLYFRIKKKPDLVVIPSLLNEPGVLQRWNECSDGSGFWENVPVVKTDNDKEFGHE